MATGFRNKAVLAEKQNMSQWFTQQSGKSESFVSKRCAKGSIVSKEPLKSKILYLTSRSC